MQLEVECSDFSYPAYHKSTLADLGLSLPGEGRPKVDCGKWRYRGCLNREGHPEGKVFVAKTSKSCNGRDCPTCVKEWARLAARRIAHRLGKFRPQRLRGPVHVVLSPPGTLYGEEVHLLRKRAYAVLKYAGLAGGVVAFHPARRKSLEDREYSPHFHVLGYGWLRSSAEVYAASGWVYKNLGQRASVFGSVWYLMSHVGFKAGFASTSWYGTMAYNKFHCDPVGRELAEKCPHCGCRLRGLVWRDGTPPFPEEFRGLTHPFGWDWDATRIDESHSYSKSLRMVREVAVEHKHKGLSSAELVG